jgi:hypothetical protein
MDQKQITIAVAGTGGKKEFTDVLILPGTKARDVLDRFKLRGFDLAKPEGGAFAYNDDLFPAVAEGQKLYATKADVEAGAHGLGAR